MIILISFADAVEVDNILQKAMKKFGEIGFSFHEVSWASPRATPLGCAFDGERHTLWVPKVKNCCCLCQRVSG